MSMMVHPYLAKRFDGKRMRKTLAAVIRYEAQRDEICRAFIDVLDSMPEDDRIRIEAILVDLGEQVRGLGPHSAIELVLKLADYLNGKGKESK